LRIGEVEDDDYCVAVFIVESEGLVAVEAGSEGVAGFFVEGSVQEDLDDAGLSDV
jgi:hypothetical protein